MKRIIAVLIIACLLFAGCAAKQSSAGSEAASAAEKNEDGYVQISQEEAAKLMQTEDCIILDVRTPEEFAEGHIPNAINFPVERMTSAEMPQLPDKNQLILVYCRSGNRSKTASKQLAQNGYTDVREFGGIIDWTGETVK